MRVHGVKTKQERRISMQKIPMMVLALVLSAALLGASSFASTTVGSSVFPAVTVPGGTVVFHTGVANQSPSSENVLVSITVTNPGGCVTNALPSHVASIA